MLKEEVQLSKENKNISFDFNGTTEVTEKFREIEGIETRVMYGFGDKEEESYWGLAFDMGEEEGLEMTQVKKYGNEFKLNKWNDKLKTYERVNSAKYIVKSKDVHCKVESEGSWRQISGLTDINYIRQNCTG